MQGSDVVRIAGYHRAFGFQSEKLNCGMAREEALAPQRVTDALIITQAAAQRCTCARAGKTLQRGKLREHFLDEQRGLRQVLLLLFNLQFVRGLGLCCQALLCRADLFFKLANALPQRSILASKRIAGRGGRVGGAGCLVESSAQLCVFRAEVTQLRGGGVLALLTVAELRLICSVRYD